MDWLDGGGLQGRVGWYLHGGGGGRVFERVKLCSGLPRILGLLGRPVQAANFTRYPFCVFTIYVYLLYNGDVTVDNHPYLVWVVTVVGVLCTVGISGHDPLINCGSPGSVLDLSVCDGGRGPTRCV